MECTPLTYTNSRLLMLTLGKSGKVYTQPWADAIAFHSDDAQQLAAWLRGKRGPTCPNDVQLVEDVQRLIDSI